MPPAGLRGDARARGALPLYALALMDREGRIHGYRVADRIEERTDGAWRPGPGAVYPALQRLVRRGLATRHRKGRRQEYEITREGRQLLTRLRARNAPSPPGAPDLTGLWSEVMGAHDPGTFLLVRLRNSVDGLAIQLERPGVDAADAAHLRSDAVVELERGLTRLRRSSRSAPVRRSPGRAA